MGIRSFHRITTKAFQRLTLRRLWCHMVYLCGDRSCPLGFQCPFSLCPAIHQWKKSNSVLSKAKTKASIQSFCFILKDGPSEPA